MAVELKYQQPFVRIADSALNAAGSLCESVVKQCYSRTLLGTEANVLGHQLEQSRVVSFNPTVVFCQAIGPVTIQPLRAQSDLTLRTVFRGAGL